MIESYENKETIQNGAQTLYLESTNFFEVKVMKMG